MYRCYKQGYSVGRGGGEDGGGFVDLDRVELRGN